MSCTGSNAAQLSHHPLIVKVAGNDTVGLLLLPSRECPRLHCRLYRLVWTVCCVGETESWSHVWNKHAHATSRLLKHVRAFLCVCLYEHFNAGVHTCFLVCVSLCMHSLLAKTELFLKLTNTNVHIIRLLTNTPPKDVPSAPVL